MDMPSRYWAWAPSFRHPGPIFTVARLGFFGTLPFEFAQLANVFIPTLTIRVTYIHAGLLGALWTRFSHNNYPHLVIFTCDSLRVFAAYMVVGVMQNMLTGSISSWTSPGGGGGGDCCHANGEILILLQEIILCG